MPSPAFSGDPRTVWLTDAGADRRMELLGDFWFDDRAGRRWPAPAGSRVDGASIPRALWTVVGSPYTGDYRRASIVHDLACVEAGGDFGRRLAADKMFFEACRAGGCSIWDSTVMFVGVRIGAWMRAAGTLEVSGRQARLRRDPLDRQIEEDFRLACEFVLSQGETDDPDEIADRTDSAIARMAGIRLVAAQGALRFAAADRPPG